MTLYEFLKILAGTKRMAVASVELWLGGSQAFNGVLRDLPVFYVLHRYTVRKLELDWDARKFIITIEREEGET
jgi:hypothetical protein